MKRSIKLFVLFALLAMIATACTYEIKPGAVALAAEEDVQTLEFEVVENGFKWSFREDGPVHEDGMPDYGNSFITEGYIYPAGTTEGGNGVLADGSPEFPDKVIGKWTCRGWNVGRGIYTETGPLAVTTQTFEFFESDGTSLTTDGYELIDEGVSVRRAVIGGTGDYMGARGESSQTFVGWNASEGFNLVFTFKLMK